MEICGLFIAGALKSVDVRLAVASRIMAADQSGAGAPLRLPIFDATHEPHIIRRASRLQRDMGSAPLDSIEAFPMLCSSCLASKIGRGESMGMECYSFQKCYPQFWWLEIICVLASVASKRMRQEG
eukprot:jgi/Botrbrau1/4472/Bobra.0220s0006.1